MLRCCTVIQRENRYHTADPRQLVDTPLKNRKIAECIPSAVYLHDRYIRVRTSFRNQKFSFGAARKRNFLILPVLGRVPLRKGLALRSFAERNDVSAGQLNTGSYAFAENSSPERGASVREERGTVSLILVHKEAPRYGI